MSVDNEITIYKPVITLTHYVLEFVLKASSNVVVKMLDLPSCRKM
jgi:hypothetical protein